MSTYYTPKDHTGNLTIPKGCTVARVYDRPKLTGLTIPEGCTEARVYNCPGLTNGNIPE